MKHVDFPVQVGSVIPLIYSALHSVCTILHCYLGTISSDFDHDFDLYRMIRI